MAKTYYGWSAFRGFMHYGKGWAGWHLWVGPLLFTSGSVRVYRDRENLVWSLRCRRRTPTKTK